jgi:hypothetical protein
MNKVLDLRKYKQHISSDIIHELTTGIQEKMLFLAQLYEIKENSHRYDLLKYNTESALRFSCECLNEMLEEYLKQ